MLDRPWVRLVLGAVVAALLGAMAARVAVSASVGGGAGGTTSGGSGSFRGGSAGDGGSGSGGGSSFGGGSGAGAESDAGGAGSGGGATATLGGGSGRVLVHVTGEVRHPGVYALAEGTRVNDAVKRAGGPTHDGDRQALNLAAPVRDGQQVRVPARVTAAAAGGAGGGGTAGAGSADGKAGGAAGPPIDLNTASLEELQTLDGVGEATAQKIVKLREERGGLAGVDDLDEIPGIGAKKLEAIRAQLEG